MSHILQIVSLHCMYMYFVLDLVTVFKSDGLLNASSSSNDKTIGVKTNQEFLNRYSQLSGNGMLLTISFFVLTNREQKLVSCNHNFAMPL